MKTLETKYEEEKRIHNERTKKQNEEILDSNTFDIDDSGNDEKFSQNLRYSSDNINSDAFSSCSTLAFENVQTKGSKEEDSYTT